MSDCPFCGEPVPEDSEKCWNCRQPLKPKNTTLDPDPKEEPSQIDTPAPVDQEYSPAPEPASVPVHDPESARPEKAIPPSALQEEHTMKSRGIPVCIYCGREMEKGKTPGAIGCTFFSAVVCFGVVILFLFGLGHFVDRFDNTYYGQQEAISNTFDQIEGALGTLIMLLAILTFYYILAFTNKRKSKQIWLCPGCDFFYERFHE